jgi:hypothetical protein
MDKEAEFLAQELLETERFRLEKLAEERRQTEVRNLAYERIRVVHINEAKGESAKLQIFTLIFNPRKYYDHNCFDVEDNRNSPFWQTLRQYFSTKYPKNIHIGNKNEDIEINKLVAQNQWDVIKEKYSALLEFYCPVNLRNELNLLFKD